jgi:predicted DNA-binding protein with PD1-like motif
MREFKLKNFYLIKLKRGEKIHESMVEFCKKMKKFGGWFFGLGTLAEAELGFFSFSKKEYKKIKLKNNMELVSLIGNIALAEKDFVVHSHCVLADKNFKVFGGHLFEAKVLATCEIIFIPFDRKVERILDKTLNLKVLKLD